MKAVLKLSEKFRGQIQVLSDDNYFFMEHDSGRFTQDGTIVNQNEIMRVCDELAQEYDLFVDPNAQQRILELVAEPDFKTKSLILPEGFILKKFQLRCMNTLAPEDKAMIQASCGTGKTLMSIAMLCRWFDDKKIDKAIVWCPSSLVGDWIANIEKFTTLDVATVNKSWAPSKRAAFYSSSPAHILVLNYERVRTADYAPIEKALSKHHIAFIIDEIQNVKGRSSTVHKNLAKLERRLKVEYRLGLTATPMMNAPEDFYNEFRLIDPNLFGRVKDFEKNFTVNEGERDYWNNYLGYCNLPEMRAAAGAEMFSADKSQPEIAKEFPQMHEIVLPLDLSKEDRAVYDVVNSLRRSIPLEKRQCSLFASTLNRICMMPEVLLDMKHGGESSYGRQSQQVFDLIGKYTRNITDSINSNKLALAIEKISELLGSGERVIVFAAWTHNCLIPLAKHLEKNKMKPLMFIGGMSQGQRDEVQKEFKSGSNKLLLMSDAGQAGLNFPECHNVIHYQTPISHGAYEQRSARVHRINSDTDQVTIYRFLTAGTIEERIESTMQGRRDMEATLGFGSEYEEVGKISEADADWLCGD